MFQFTWADTVPKDTWKPQSNANLNDAKYNVMGISATQINSKKMDEWLYSLCVTFALVGLVLLLPKLF